MLPLDPLQLALGGAVTHRAGWLAFFALGLFAGLVLLGWASAFTPEWPHVREFLGVALPPVTLLTGLLIGFYLGRDR